MGYGWRLEGKGAPFEADGGNLAPWRRSRDHPSTESTSDLDGPARARAQQGTGLERRRRDSDDERIGRGRTSRPRGRRTEPRRGIPKSEPAPSSDDEDWIEWGGELILAVGETSGGAPFGTSLEDFRQSNEHWEREAGWARAKRALRAAFEGSSPRTELDIGFVEALGRGLTRDAFGTSIDLQPDPRGQSGAYVALVPNGGAPRYGELVRRELDVLRWLAGRTIGVRVPRAVALVDDRGAPILVESFIEGVAVDLRAGRQPIRPWEVVAEVAATIHTVPPPPTLAPRDRRAHRLEIIESLERVAHTPVVIVEEALAWMRDHLGGSAPGMLLHGDLLGQNLRIHPSEATGVIDWHHVEVGDPAADLAIVTRGVRRPFQLAGGRLTLLDAYNERSATEVSAESLRFFELALATRGVIEADQGQHRDAWLHQLEHMLGTRPGAQ